MSMAPGRKNVALRASADTRRQLSAPPADMLHAEPQQIIRNPH